MKHARGYTLIFVLGVVALLAGLAAMLAGPSTTQHQRADLHYRKVQAEFLSLSGIERATVWTTRGIVTNSLYPLANGTVDVKMLPKERGRIQVTSVGRIRVEGRKNPVEATHEATIQLP